ncbi:uracil-xanthine permease [Oleidesulfovibrio alaskensis G20]|uniref:Uracil-xanthine permease n=1 Tax=Oleidesulfovibrio alaskensis (strain ATCC BAA-1058 / DSM 17464 / G20) TaxID=207559 RepID=Q311Z8_OLEA2|nr:uracil-xanthine permease family protein [Oleidesulfovibrio alaskensis]ABB38248.2 uracil-xanthine permease [Oleidesulfovibrio alaskensis G20]MBG0774295.1 uracil-xanthine permease [Oleidesulfovibrio alaskensis]MBL3581188.1 uracil-xanthine permease [Oleidesulfovibrio alaskensis]
MVSESTEYSFRLKDSLIGAQMLFVAFGALVLVPLLTGLDPNVALFTAGAGTLVFQLITKRQVPIFLASSFAFIAPIIHGVATWGIPATMGGLVAAGLLYVLLGTMIKIQGTQILDRVLPTIVTGPVIMVIGLVLAPAAVFMALGKTGDGSAELFARNDALVVSMISLVATIGASMFGRGVIRLIPIICGIAAGYTAALAYGMVDFTRVIEAPWLAVPSFVAPEFNIEAIIFIVPVAIAPAIEHVGDVLAISSVTGKNYIDKPGVHRTMIGDGIATMFASLLGGPPNTTYSEVTGAVALTRSFNPGIMTWAAITAILLAFVGKLGALLQTIPTPVMGGIMILLFGAIVVVGVNSLVRAQQDLMEPRNLAIISVILVFGIGGMAFHAGEFSIKGIGLAGITGVVLNMILPKPARRKR